MLHIAILDDQLEEAIKTKSLLITYLEKRNLSYDRIVIYQQGKDILQAEIEYDVLFLDVEVGNENGIEIAKKLREKQPYLIIVVITSYIKYSIEGYKIQAARYLLKPVAPSLFFSELDEVLKNYIEQESIILQNHQEEIRIKINEIYYFESYGRKVKFYKKKTAYISREKVSYWAAILDNNFIECYKGIYVHLQYVESIHKEYLYLDNQQKLPISRRRHDALKRAWMAYQEQII